MKTLKKPAKGRRVTKNHRAAERNRNLLRYISLALLLFIPLGLSSMFNFTEFRSTDIRFSSIFNRNRTYAYGSIMNQDIASHGQEVFYTLETQDGRSTRLNVSNLKAETVRLVDSKLPENREVRFTSTAVDLLVEQGIYTWEEAIRIYAPRD